MAEEVLMPRLGQSVESSLILSWEKKEGETVKAGETLCEIETDKATFEVEAVADGTLLKVLYDEGDDVPVLTPIAIIGEPGEKIKITPKTELPADHSPDVAPEVASKVAPEVVTKVTEEFQKDVRVASRPQAGSEGTALKISPRAKKLAEEKGIEIAREIAFIPVSGPNGRIVERDVKSYLSTREPLTPAAIEASAKLAAPPPPTGTGIGGRVTVEDVRRAITQVPVAPEPSPEAVSAAHTEPGGLVEVPVKGIRKLIADRMHQSLQSTAQLSMTSSAEAKRLQQFRKRLKVSPEQYGLQGVTINDLILFAVARTLPVYKECNAHFMGDKILQFGRVHLASAVDTPRGLMVPVIKNAHRMSLLEISTEAQRLRDACLQGSVVPDDLVGGTFTVTNMGILGIESFTPILNPPQVAILGVCTIKPMPREIEGEISFVPSINLSLTINHQAVDGAPAARFLQALVQAVEQIDLTLAM